MTPERRSALTCVADPTVVRSMSDTSDVFVMALLDSSPDCIKLVERDGSLSYMNPNGQCAMEIDDFTMVAGAQWKALWPKESQDAIAASVTAALAGETSRIEAFCPTAKGRARWWDVSVSPVLNGKGEVVRVLSVSRDITPIIEREDRLKAYDVELKALNKQLSQELERSNVLMREVDHRVKNSLAMIAGILRIQSRRAVNDATRGELEQAAARVATVGRVHERLQLGEDTTSVRLHEYLPAIAEDVSAALSESGIAVCSDIAEQRLDSDRAIALGLITSELLTNAVKHAFDDMDADCEVHVELAQDGDDIVLVVRDNGRGGCEDFSDEQLSTATPQQTGGLGARIVSLYVQQLEGTIACDSPAGVGTTVTLRFPA